MNSPDLADHLDLVSTVDLRNALLRRFDHIIFHGYKHRPIDDDPLDHIKAWGTKGDPHMMIGLAFEIIAKCQKYIETGEVDAQVSDL